MARTLAFRCLLGTLFVGLALVLTATTASAGAQITVDPNAQYGAYTAWVNGVGENGQGLVMDNTAPPGKVPGSFAAAIVAGTTGLLTTGIQLGYDLYEPDGVGSDARRASSLPAHLSVVHTSRASTWRSSIRMGATTPSG
jgi:hypothetical protein